MNTKVILLTLVMGALLVVAARAEEPPNDTIVQDTLRELDLLGFQELPGPETSTGATIEQHVVSDLLEAGVWIKSERLSRSGIEVYQVNKAVPGFTDALLLPGQRRDDAMVELGSDHVSGIAEYLEVVKADIGGKEVRYATAIPPDEVQRLKAEANTGMPVEDLAVGLRGLSAASLFLGGLLQDELARSGVGYTGDAGDWYLMTFDGMNRGKDCFEIANGFYETAPDERGMGGVSIKPWVSPSPFLFMMGPACVWGMTADVMDGTYSLPQESAEEISRALTEAAESIEYVGLDTVDGRTAHKVRADNLNLVESFEGQEFHFNSVSQWIDAEYFVPRKMRIEGTVHADGESREFFLEKLQSDYRNVPNSSLYEPYREVMRMGGMISPEQQAEMREAQGQIEDYERQIAGMPPDQRAMMERMVGDKIKQLRSMADGGAFEFELITTSIVLNPDFGSGMQQAILNTGNNLVREIQIDLSTLGYDPGNTAGELTQQTVVAIVKFESDNGLEISGEATPRLAAALAAAVERM